MSRPHSQREANITLRVDSDVLLWARTRAVFARTTVNALVRQFLEEYAAVPERFRDGLPPPWREAGDTGPGITEVVDTAGAGVRARLAHDAAASLPQETSVR